MVTDVKKLRKFNDLLSKHSQRRHTIVLNPKGEYKNFGQPDEEVEYDKDEWKIPENLSTWISELEKKSMFNTEEKILLLYQKLCKDFIYDDNLISYIRKSDDDTFLLPDWYGRDTDEKWTENREQHNRRVCFELSRYLATSLNELLKNKEGYHTCILWDKGLTHYFVGLTCGEYSITLDTDDFNNIKDLTRLKTGLTAEGIKVWEDEEGKFQRALDQFNKKRDRYSIERISNDIESQELEQPKEEEPEDIAFLRNAIKVLIEKYDIDSQGIFEYMKEIVDIKHGPEKRKKVWKKIEGEDEKATRYIRCLIVNLDGKEYIIDGDKGILRPFDAKEFDKKDAEFFRFHNPNIGKDTDEHYDGR